MSNEAFRSRVTGTRRVLSPTARAGNSRNASLLVEAHLPCSRCGSSDALARYDDGHTYCFSCGAYEDTPKKGVDESQDAWYNIKTVPEGDTIASYLDKNNNNKERSVSVFKSYTEIDGPGWRGIEPETMKFFDVKCRISDGAPHSFVFPWGGSKKQIREVREKRFYMEGTNEGSDPLFGMSKFPMGSASAITVTEGVLDCLSAFQMLGSKYPCVSVLSSSTAKSDAQKAFKYLDSFEKIYLAFDNDEPGIKALKQVASLFDPNKIYVVPISDPYKDANDFIKNGNHSKEFHKVWWSSRKHRPKGIIESFSDIKEVLEAQDARPVATYPFPTLQEMTYGIRLGEVNLITAQEKVGKGLALDTPLPTPTGWTTVGDLSVGDLLLTPKGTTTKVTYLSPIVSRQNYLVTFSDKTSIQTDDVHRWTVRTLDGKVIPTIDTETMYNEGPVVLKKSKARYMVPSAEAIDLPTQPVGIHPFLLGVWLADGNSRDSRLTVSRSKRDKILERGFHIASEAPNSTNSTQVRFHELTIASLREYDLLCNKHIPPVYLRGSIEQRKDLFEGLLFDGWSRTTKNKQENEYYSSDERLFNDVVELARSLGYIVSVRTRMGKYCGKETKTAYSFRYRKASWKAIRNIEKVPTVETRCLTVDDPDHLFLAGDGWTATHNTAFMSALEHHLIKTTDYGLGIIHLEQAQKRSIQGILNYELDRATNLPDSGVSNEDMLKAYEKLVRKEGRVHFYSHFGSDDPDVILDIIRYLVAVCGCKFIFLDHITMLVTGMEGDDERRQLDYLSTRLAMLTRELNFTLFLVSHVNDDGKTRGSRNISKVADLILYLTRDTENASFDIRNTTTILIKGNRDVAASGPAGYLFFDNRTYTLHEKTVEDVLVDNEGAF